MLSYCLFECAHSVRLLTDPLAVAEKRQRIACIVRPLCLRRRDRRVRLTFCLLASLFSNPGYRHPLGKLYDFIFSGGVQNLPFAVPYADKGFTVEYRLVSTGRNAPDRFAESRAICIFGLALIHSKHCMPSIHDGKGQRKNARDCTGIEAHAKAAGRVECGVESTAERRNRAVDPGGVQGRLTSFGHLTPRGRSVAPRVRSQPARPTHVS